jgi:RNase P subunit RPR2
MKAYCVKCKALKDIKNARAFTMKNGKAATRGECTDCGTKTVRIGKS